MTTPLTINTSKSTDSSTTDETSFSDLVSGFWGSLSGSNAADAAAAAAADQVAFSNEAMDLLREDLGPFRDLLSGQQIGGISQFASDPETQARFLETNPLFAGMKDRIREDVFNAQSAGGALGSTGTDEMLSSKFLEAGNALVNQQANRALPLLNAGQASAAQAGVGSAELLTGIGNALAGGQIGAANANAQGQENAIAALSTIAGLFN